jgi:uncharacterized GH25 family protein
MTAIIVTAMLGRVSPTPAHEMWLTPSHPVAAAGDTIAVRCFVGTGFRGEPKPYAAPRTIRFAQHGARDRDLTRAAVNGELVYARFVAPDPGGTLVEYQSNFATIELPAPEFDAYLRLEGLDGPLADRARQGAAAGPGRERYARCLKTWVAGNAPNRAQLACGLPLEIVPLSSPEAGGALELRVTYRGKPLAGALVRAWRAPFDTTGSARDAAVRDSVGPSAQARTDAAGIATIVVDQPGEWMLNTVHMVPSEDRAQADWQSYWASYTFCKGARRR